MNDFVGNIRKAVTSLKADDEASWTKTDGKPSVERVREIANDPSITRADIEAAMPNFTREGSTAKAGKRESAGGVADAEKEPHADNTPTTEASNEDQQANENAPAGSSTVEPKANQEDDARRDDGEGAIPEPEMNVSDFVARGLLMAVIMRLPNPMRIMADKTMLDDMAGFVSAYKIHEERMIVVEMIKSIAETKMNEIPSGQYKGRVQAAMDVVRGEIDHVRTGIAPADDKIAAAARLARITGQGGAPVPGQAIKSALDGTDEQKKAHARLYGDPPSE